MEDQHLRVRPRPIKALGRSAVPRREDRTPFLLGLQHRAGNRAVAGLVRSVQRVGGWTGADTSGKGWNAGEQLVGQVRRVPIEGLINGEQRNWRSGASKQLTNEAAGGRAIALVPNALDPKAPVDVLLHLHGYAETTDRPFAGWRQHKTRGTVRDVDLDQVAQQIEGAGQRQLIGLLPQGGEQSEFGGLKGDPYIGEVLDKLVSLGALKSRPPSGRVVLSAHSGGGHTVRRMLAGGTQGGLPSGLGMITLFEAINNAKELEQMANWVRAELDRHVAVLTDPARSAPDKKSYLAGVIRMRAYFNPNRSYAKRHRALGKAIDDWFVANTARLGSYAADLRELHQVVEQNVSHERQVRTGLQDALGVTARGGGQRPAGGGAPAKAGTAAGQGSTSPTGPPPPVDAPPVRRSLAERQAMITADAVVAGVKEPTWARLTFQLGVGMGTPPMQAAAAILVSNGLNDSVNLTDALFAMVNRELGGKRIPSHREDLKSEWRTIRNSFARPALATAPKATSTDTAPVVIPGGKDSPATTKGGAVTEGPSKKPQVTAPKSKTPGGGYADEETEYAALTSKVKELFEGKGGFKYYKGIRTLYAKRDEINGDPVGWLNNLEWGVPFCGSKLRGIHPLLTSALSSIDERCTELAVQVKAAGGPVVFEGKFQPRAVTGNPNKLSDHGLGLALHLNYTNNPYIGRNSEVSALIEKIAAGAGHDKFWDSIKGKGRHTKEKDIERVYRLYAETSDAVAAYFRAIDVMAAAAKAGTLDDTGKAEMAKRQREMKLFQDKDFSGRDPRKGFFAHTAGVSGDPMLEIIKQLTGPAGLEWGGVYGSKPKDMHHFALKL